jgi:hypothetical protein
VNREWLANIGIINYLAAPKITADCRLPIADCRLPIADCRLPIADCRLPIADCRLPIADCRLPLIFNNSPIQAQILPPLIYENTLNCTCMALLQTLTLDKLNGLSNGISNLIPCRFIGKK